MLSVIIPAYNEEKRIAGTIREIAEYLENNKYAYEIIIVDDGSIDRTASIAGRLNMPNVRLIKHRWNKGKGAAVRTGMLAAKGDYILFTDADHSTPIDELEKFMQQIKGFDIVIGSRSIKGSRVEEKQPLYRMLLGKIFNKIVRIITVRGIVDTQCGFKLFTRKAARDIFQRQLLDRWSFDVELLYIGRKHGYLISETPVRWSNRKESRVDAFKESFRMLRDLFVIRWNDFRGRYK